MRSAVVSFLIAGSAAIAPAQDPETGSDGAPAVSVRQPPPEGKMRVRRLRVVAGLFGNVGETVEDAAALPALPDEGYARIERELFETAAWYFQHSGRRLWIDLTPVRRAVPVSAASLSASGKANGTPATPLLRSLAKDAGVPFADVDGFVVAMDFRRRATADGPIVRVGRGGGLTYGAHGRGYGLSWWFVPGTPGYDAWLFCHEFHHQLDALFELSGHPEYPFNHFAPNQGNVAFFGEHWDGNRWVLQGWPDRLWDRLRSGDVVLVDDRDGDRIADRDPRLPFDEERFGSDPNRADTDGDGLDDGVEASLGRWLTESGFESQLGARIEPNPRSPDSDGDGVPDTDDPLPLLAVETTLPDGEWTTLREIDDPRLSVTARLRLIAGAIEVRTESPDAADLEVQALLDLDADGWFRGRINARVRTSGMHARVVDVLDASSPSEWPASRPDLRDELVVELQRGAGAVTLTIRPLRGLRPGDEFALALSYRGPLDGDDQRWWSLFEPHRLLKFEVGE